MMIQDPMTKLIKQYVTAVVGVDLGEDFLCVRDSNAVGLQQWDCLFELLQGNSAVLACVDFIEDAPIAVIISQVLQQKSKLCFGDVIIAIFVGSFEFIFGHVKSPDDDGFKLKEFWQFNNIPDALINFSQAKIAIAVDIKPRPICRSISRWQFLVNDLDDLTRFHIYYKISYINYTRQVGIKSTCHIKVGIYGQNLSMEDYCWIVGF